MKQVYADLSPATGVHVAGICTIQIAPITWLQTEWIQQFLSGKVMSIALLPGKQMISLELLQQSYKFNEQPKDSKAGTFYDISIAGTSNYTDDALLQVLNTYRYQQWFALIKDRNANYRICGNINAGLSLSLHDLLQSFFYM